MIEIGHILRFVPPILAGGQVNNKIRYMLVVDKHNSDNTLELVNISSIKDVSILTYKSNFPIFVRHPLPRPSFAKLGSYYILENFAELEKHKLSDKLNHTDVSNIIKARTSISNKEQITISKTDFMTCN